MDRTHARQGRGLTLVVAGLAAVLVATAAVGMLPAEAEQHRPEPPAPAEPITQRAEFTDDVAIQIRKKFDGRGTDVMNMRDASNAVVAEFTLGPDEVFPWHTHPGPVVVNIADGDDDGAFVYILADDCVEREYDAGQALIDAGGDNVHSAYNPSDSEDTVVIATILGAPDGAPLTQPVSDDEADSMDARCDMQTPRVGQD